MLSRTRLLALTLMAGHCMAIAIPPSPLVEHGVLPNSSPTLDEDFNPTSNGNPTLRKRQHTKPEWMIVRRLGNWHLQQLAAGQKIEVDGNEHLIDMLRGSGGGVDIYILDSGIRTSHVAFREGRASNFKDIEYTPYLSRDATWDDKQGHGTHVAALAGGGKHGVAQWANLINVKIEHCEQEQKTNNEGQRETVNVCRSETQGVLDAIKDVTAKHNEKKANPPRDWKGSVINMSLGLSVKSSNAIRKALKAAYDAGIPIAVAAGNRVVGSTEKAGGVLCESEHTICVGATRRDYKKLDIGRDGPKVDIWAPGSGLLSADSTGDRATKHRTGTSMACPLVAGIMATIVGYEGPLDDSKNTQFVYDRLKNNALKDVLQDMASDEVNAFAQTGINSPKDNGQERKQPYPGIPNDFFIFGDPYGVQLWAKRESPEVEEVGYKTTEVQNPDPNDVNPLLFVQEALDAEDEAQPGDDSYQPEITGDVNEEDGDVGGGSGPAKPICQGNQIYEDCEGGKLPEIKDNSGPQQPVCMKADSTPGSPARLNEQKLLDAAAGYCKELVDKKWLFKEGAPTPRAPVLDGQAQNGKSMSLAALFHKGSCPPDKNEMNMADVGYDKCVENLGRTLSTFCGLDESWGDKFVKDFEVLGGIFATDCVMYSAFGGAL